MNKISGWNQICVLNEFSKLLRPYHSSLFSGESPSEADLNLLDTARKVELYGIKMQPAKVSDLPVV